MSKLIVIRHTETLFNKEKIFSGCLDTPLSQNGIQQALSLLKQISNEIIDIVYVSQLNRTKETAALLMQSYYEQEKTRYPIFTQILGLRQNEYIPIISDQRLNERSYGILEGRLKKQVEELYGKQQLFVWRRGWESAPKDGESLHDVYNRVYEFIIDSVIPNLNNKKNVLIICHQNSMRAIKIFAERIDIDRVAQVEFSNGQILKYEYDSCNGTFSLS